MRGLNEIDLNMGIVCLVNFNQMSMTNKLEPFNSQIMKSKTKKIKFDNGTPVNQSL